MAGSSWATNDATAKSIFQAVGLRNAPKGAVPFRGMANHAEPGTFLQAFLDANRTGHGRLFVDSTLCDMCGKGGLAALGRGLGLESLEVWQRLPNGMVVLRTRNLLK
jgi:hypothetical protein